LRKYQRENKASSTDSLGYYELKQHNTWFDEECSKLLDERKRTKLHWLQNPSEMNRAKSQFTDSK